MKFKSKELTPDAYKAAFLIFVDELVPEVMKKLKTFVPKYNEVFGSFDYHQANRIFDSFSANKTEDVNYILSELDKDFRRWYPDTLFPSKEIAPKTFEKFQQDFYKFIQLYGLEKQWLEQHLFGLLYHLSNSPQHYTKLYQASAHSYIPYSGGPLIFEFEGWRIENESADYKKAAIATFKKYLLNYIKETEKKAELSGYTVKGRPKEFEQVKWLVHWTVQNWTMKELFAAYDTSKIKNGIRAYMNFERKVNNAFERLEEEYDLPRKYKKHSKAKNL